MPAIEKKLKVYDTWDGGNWGADGSINAAKASPFKYRAINLQVYANGSLGPRPGWNQLAPTGTPPSAESNSDFFGMLWLPTDQDDNGILLFVSTISGADTVRLSINDMAYLTSTLGAVSGSSLGYTEGNSGSFTYINPSQVVVGAVKLYNPSANTVATITYPSSFVPQAAMFYKDRLYAWGDTTYPNRVYYSNFGAFSTFSAGDYFDIGTGGTTAATRSEIRGAWVLKDQLVFLVATGAPTIRDSVGEFWTLQGPNPITGSLSRIYQGRTPRFPTFCAKHNEVLVGMDHGTGRGSMIISPQGVDNRALSYIRPGNERYQYSTARNVAATTGEEALIMPYVVKAQDDDIHGTIAVDSTDPGGDGFSTAVTGDAELGLQAWSLVHGVWTKELWWNGAVAETQVNLTNTETDLLFAVVPFLGDKLLAATNASTSGPDAGTWRIYSRDVCLDRPSRTTDTWSEPTEPHTDLSGTPFGIKSSLILPEEMAEVGCGVRVHRVIVEFDYWKGSNFSPATTADFSMQVRYRGLDLGPDLDTDEFGGADGSFDYLVETGNRDTPMRGRRVFKLPEAALYGSFQVQFPSVRNVAFRKVTVLYEEKQTETM